ncbi:MAG: hypothetical protein H8E91_06305 [Planctomycetes bacterium]|nr:hypothetical protein [Planctomycetota bacterium]
MRNENRQFDPQEQKMEDVLSKALSGADTPKGLADRVMTASAPMLDQVSALLEETTHVTPPAGLAERVMAASAPMLGSPEFQHALTSATKVHTPVGLEDRIMAASQHELQGESPVIGRIGFTVKMQRLALAACVVFAVLVAIRMDVHSTPRVVTTTTSVTNAPTQENHVLSAEEEGYLLDDLDLSEYAYLADARELNYTALSFELNGLREDLESWQYGLLTE